MMKEIEEPNEEDRMRDASGGNIQPKHTCLLYTSDASDE